MANKPQKSPPAPGKAVKKAPSAAPERDPYAYYDDLYEKKPRKKKKANEDWKWKWNPTILDWLLPQTIMIKVRHQKETWNLPSREQEMSGYTCKTK